MGFVRSPSNPARPSPYPQRLEGTHPAETRPALVARGRASGVALGSRSRVTPITLIGDVPTALQEHHSTNTPENDANSQDADNK